MKNWEKCCPCFASFAFSSSSPSSPDPSVRRRRAVPPPLLPSLHCHRRCCCLIAYVDIFRRNHIKKNFLPAIGQSLQHAAASQSYYCNSRQFCIFIRAAETYEDMRTGLHHVFRIPTRSFVFLTTDGAAVATRFFEMQIGLVIMYETICSSSNKSIFVDFHYTSFEMNRLS